MCVCVGVCVGVPVRDLLAFFCFCFLAASWKALLMGSSDELRVLGCMLMWS